MNWSAIGAVGEIVGAMAVVATLVYLAIQIRQNTAQNKAASHQAISDSLNEINFLFAKSADVSELWLKGMQDRVGLTDGQRWQFDAMARAYFHVCETMFVQAELGAGDRGIMVAEERGMKIVLAMPGGREWWMENPFGFSEEFREYVDHLMASTTTRTG